MVYYDKNLILKDMQQNDIDLLVAAECAQGWGTTPERFVNRLKDRDAGKCITIVALLDKMPIGYVSVYKNVDWGPIDFRGCPEIVDFAVLEKYRGKGIGTLLMDTAEDIAKGFGRKVFLAVGLHSGYGAAQVMYYKRGYSPDGTGAWYGDRLAKRYNHYCLDDYLVLYLWKALSD